MYRKFFSIVLPFFLAACGDEAPDSVVAPQSDAPIVQMAGFIDESSYRQHIATLASDEFGGRGPATAGEELTVNYLVNAFKAMGLEPANGDRYT